MHFLRACPITEMKRTFLRRHPHIHVPDQSSKRAVIAKRTMHDDVDALRLERTNDALGSRDARGEAHALSLEPARVEGAVHVLDDIGSTLEPSRCARVGNGEHAQRGAKG